MEYKKKVLLAYHGDAAIKEKYLARVRAHAKANRLIRGVGWSNGKGCAIGCTLEAYDYTLYEAELGIPRQLAALEDVLFERLPRGEAMLWPAMFLSVIRPGANLELVFGRFMVWVLTDPKEGVIRFADGDGEKAIERVAELWNCRLNGIEPSSASWRAAASAALSASWRAASAAARAAASAAESAARSAAASAAESAPWIAVSSAAASAAWSAVVSATESEAWSAAAKAARSAAMSAAASAAYRRMSAKLIELLRRAPV